MCASGLSSQVKLCRLRGAPKSPCVFVSATRPSSLCYSQMTSLTGDFTSLGVRDPRSDGEDMVVGSPHDEENGDGTGDSGAGEHDSQRRRRQRGGVRPEGRRRGYQGGGVGGSGEVASRMLLPSSRIGGVIGRGGDVIKSIRESTGARINIATGGSDDRDPQFRLVTITGTMGAVCQAVELAASHAGMFEHHHRGPRGHQRDRDAQAGEDGDEAHVTSPSHQHEPGLRLVIDAAAAGQLIGKRGATINEIRSQSGARIQVVGEDESVKEGALPEERVVLVLGDVEGCRRAHQLICAVLSAEPGGVIHALHAARQMSPVSPLLRSYACDDHVSVVGASAKQPPPYAGGVGRRGGGRGPDAAGGDAPPEESEDSCQVIMRISNDKIGRVIGKEGSTINKIRQESAARIEIENSRTGENAMRVIRIRGNMQQTQLAQQLITEKMNAV